MKPISAFLDKWSELLNFMATFPDQEKREAKTTGANIAVVGGGAAGLEVAMILQRKLGQKCSSINLFQSADRLLPTHPKITQNKLAKRASQMGLNIYLNEKVTSYHDHVITTSSGKQFACDRAIWATQASAPSWIAKTGLPTDSKGFIKVKRELQVEGHPIIFAAGDCIAFPTPLAKSGVYAVRQGKVLANNLRSALLGAKRQKHKPQKNFLSLITAGEPVAYASKRVYLGSGHLWWLVKDYIDRKFMQKWQDYSQITQNMDRKFANQDSLNALDVSFTENDCGGCGSKMDPQTLFSVLSSLESPKSNSTSLIEVGLKERDDAMVTKPLHGQQITESVDMFRSFISDPYLFGKIATLHAISDLYAIGSKPFSAQALIQLPDAPPTILARDLKILLQGIGSVLKEEGIELTGGHTTVGSELQAGFAVMGVLSQLSIKTTCQDGDELLLTKPLGTGACLRAHMQGDLSARDLEEILSGMLGSNGIALDLLEEFQIHAMTDISGFGLAGHLFEMLGASSLQAVIDLPSIPIYCGYHDAIKNRHMGTLASATGMHIKASVPNIMLDPQTSGGLLIAVPKGEAQKILDRIRSKSSIPAARIGAIRARASTAPPMVIESTV